MGGGRGGGRGRETLHVCLAEWGGEGREGRGGGGGGGGWVGLGEWVVMAEMDLWSSVLDTDIQ